MADAEMLHLLKLQQKSIITLNALISNFGKAGSRRNEQSYLQNRITELTSWWNEFLTRNQELQQYMTNDQPYFAEKTFESVKTNYTKHRRTIEAYAKSQKGESVDSQEFDQAPPVALFEIPKEVDDTQPESSDGQSNPNAQQQTMSNGTSNTSTMQQLTIPNSIPTTSTVQQLTIPNSIPTTSIGAQLISPISTPISSNIPQSNIPNPNILPNGSQQPQFIQPFNGFEFSDIQNPIATSGNLNNGVVRVLSLFNDLKESIELIDWINDSATAGYVSAQMAILKEIWTDFRSKYMAERDSNEQMTMINFKFAQTNYATALGKLNDILTKKNRRIESSIHQSMPKEFSGKLDEWPAFIALYDKSIHESEFFSNATKITKLKSLLKGEAEKLVAHIIPSPDNYEICYSILRNRFDNKRAMLSKLLDMIFAIHQQKFESGRDLKTLHDVTTECVLSIKAMGINIENWDPLLNHIILHKLAPETIKHYECSLANVKEPQSYEEFMTYINGRAAALLSAEDKNRQHRQHNQVNGSSNLSHAPHNNDNKKANSKMCNYCKVMQLPQKQSHSMQTCEHFGRLSTSDRIAWINKNKLCNNCFSNSHSKKDCKSKYTCRLCKKKHNTLLHLEQATTANIATTTNNAEIERYQTFSHIVTKTKDVLLATAVVISLNKSNDKLFFRILLDQGSQSNFITEAACQTLGLKKRKAAITVMGIGSTPKTATSVTDLTIHPRFKSNFSLPLTAIVMTKLTSVEFSSDISRYSHLNNLLFADPAINSSQRIDILLGAAEYAKILKVGLIKGANDEPIAQNSEFGWIISGSSNGDHGQSKNSTSSILIEHTLSNVSTIDDELNRIFNTDDVPEDVMPTEECKTFGY